MKPLFERMVYLSKQPQHTNNRLSWITIFQPKLDLKKDFTEKKKDSI